MKSRQELQRDYNALLLQMALAEDLEEETERLTAQLEETDGGDTRDIAGFFASTEQNTRRLIDREVRKQKLAYFARHSLPKAGRVAAMFLLVLLIGLTTAVAAVRPFRAKVLELLIRMDDPRYTELTLVENEGAAFDVPPDWKGSFYLSFIPEGFVLSLVESLDVEHHVEYSNGDGGHFTFSEAGVDTHYRIDTENAEVRTIFINGSFGIISVKEEKVIVAWSFQEKYFVVSGNLDETTSLRIAEGVSRIF